MTRQILEHIRSSVNNESEDCLDQAALNKLANMAYDYLKTRQDQLKYFISFDAYDYKVKAQAENNE